MRLTFPAHKKLKINNNSFAAEKIINSIKKLIDYFKKLNRILKNYNWKLIIKLNKN